MHKPVVKNIDTGVVNMKAECVSERRDSRGGTRSSHSDSLSLMVTAFTSVYSARAYSPLKVKGESAQNRSVNAQ